MQVVVNGLLTHYETVGSGPIILVLHGWGDDSRSWAGFSKSLCCQWQVVTVDLPGFGATQSPDSAWGLDEYARFVSEFLAKVAISPFAVVGHSNGGAIAIRGLKHGDITADKLVLLASAGIRGEYKGKLKALRMAAKTAKVLVAPLPKGAKSRLRKKAYKKIGSDMLVAEHLQGTFKKIVGDDVRKDARQLALPALIIYGENDEQTPPAYGQTFHELIVDSELHVLPKAGHFIHTDQPKRVQRLVEGFLE